MTNSVAKSVFAYILCVLLWLCVYYLAFVYSNLAVLFVYIFQLLVWNTKIFHEFGKTAAQVGKGNYNCGA